MSKEWYTWAKSYKGKALAMLNAINNNPRFPVVGKNAKSGATANGKQRMVRWADDLIEWTDGRFGFQRIPTELLDAMDVPMEERQSMLDTFAPRIDTERPAIAEPLTT